MTVFSLNGTKIQTDPDGQITSIQDAMLEAVTRIGTNTLDVAYLGDTQNHFAVSLGDYNLLFDKIHINDADLPDQVEFFDLSAEDGADIRVLNFVFTSDSGVEERMFSVGETPLPQLRTPSDASMFFAQREPLKVTPQETLTIHLDQVTNVKTSGVFISVDALSTDFTFEDDGFDFIELDKNSDADVWDVEFANAAHLEDAFAATLGTQPHHSEHHDDEIWDDNPNDSPNDPIPGDLDNG